MPRVEDRIIDLERQLAMLERMIQMLGDTLDRRFERYEQVIESQSHKIGQLTILLFSMVDEQYKWSRSLREKVSRISPKNDVFYEWLGRINDPDPDHTTSDNITTGNEYTGLGSTTAASAVASVTGLTQPQSSQESKSQPPPEPSPPQQQQRSRRQRPAVFTGKFQFLKSPHSVREVWKEYVEGIDGQLSIREMENLYQTGWRRDPAVNKRYARRKVLWRAIENGLSRGYSLEYIINLLEEYRYIDKEKGIKHPIGWICQNHNIPEVLR